MSENQGSWEQKPVLRKIYREFHNEIRHRLRDDIDGVTVELGSGIGQIKDVIPACITTDVVPNHWLDRTENAYRLSFVKETVANLIAFDVWHHLRYPGTALREIRRVLAPGGRVVIFEPCMSLLGLLVYGVFHHEPLGLRQPITWFAPEDYDASHADYFAAAGNAWRTFHRREHKMLDGWRVVEVKRFSAISYVASGGFRGPQLYPTSLLPLLRSMDALFDLFPAAFATRMLIVLEKTLSPAASPEATAKPGTARAKQSSCTPRFTSLTASDARSPAQGREIPFAMARV